MLGVTFSIDEMTVRFKGNHADKKSMKYKEKGDGLKTYAICRKGYTYQIFMCNYPLPEKYLDKSMFPLHYIVMAFFDTVEGKHHQRAIDNLYKSAAFFKAA